MKSLLRNTHKVYCLFEDRHDLPENEGPICKSFDFHKFCVNRHPNWYELLYNGGSLIVTGFTPALTEFLEMWVHEHHYRKNDLYAQYKASYVPVLTLLHYNTNTKQYIKKQF